MNKQDAIAIALSEGRISANIETGIVKCHATSGNRLSKEGRIITHKNEWGYLSSTFTINRKQYAYKVHHVIWVAAGNILPSRWVEGKTLDHINRDITDNRISNLRIATEKEQSMNKVIPFGETHPFHILTNDNVIEIKKRMINGERPTQIANEMGIKRTTITGVYYGKAWNHVMVSI